MDFEHRSDVALDACLSMAAGKTAALLGSACALGALFEGGSAEQVECLQQFGRGVGMAFQFVDDVLGIWGDPAVTGKPVTAGSRQPQEVVAGGVRPVIGHGGGTRAGRAVSGGPALTPTELERAATLVDATGGRVWARQEAERRVAEALTCLRAADPAPQAAADLAALAGLITHRDR